MGFGFVEFFLATGSLFFVQSNSINFLFLSPSSLLGFLFSLLKALSLSWLALELSERERERDRERRSLKKPKKQETMATQPPQQQATTADDAPLLLVQHADRAPPLGALLAAEVAGVAVEAKVDPKLAKGAEPVLVLPGGGYVFLILMDRKNQAVAPLPLTSTPRQIFLSFSLCLLTSTSRKPSQKQNTKNNNDGYSGKLEGLAAISRYIAKVAPESSGLYPQNSVADAVRADSFVDFAAAQLRNGPGLEAALEALDAFLALRTRLVGDDAPADDDGASSPSSSSPSSHSSHSALSIADFAAWGALQSSGLWTKLKKRFPHAARWHALVGATRGAAELAERHGLAFKSAFQLSKERGAAGLGGGDTGSFDIGLPNARKGAVVTRFPPEPSGYLHVGHAKAALLNDFFAKHYEGQMILRFDDTNPDKESTEFTESILADLKTLGVEHSRLTYTSDYFPQLLELGEALLKGGHAYADDTPMEQMQRERREKVESRCRARSVEENLALWKEMVAGTDVGKKNCIRFKMDMQAANGTLRDPVAYRCNDTPHWRTGGKYKVRGLFLEMFEFFYFCGEVEVGKKKGENIHARREAPPRGRKLSCFPTFSIGGLLL